MPRKLRHRYFQYILCVGLSMILLQLGWASENKPPSICDWVPPKASDWTSLGPRLNDANLQAMKTNPKVGGGVVWAPLVSVDRTNGIRVKPSFKQGTLVHALDQKYTRLLLNAGMRDSEWDRVRLKVFVDDKEVFATKPYDYGTLIRCVGRKAEAIDLDVSIAKTLRFELTVINNRYWNEDVLVLGNALLLAK